MRLLAPDQRSIVSLVLPVLLLLHLTAMSQATAQPVEVGSDGGRRLQPRKHLIKPTRSTVPSGFDRLRVMVKFQDEMELAIDKAGVPSSSRAGALRSSRAFSVLRHSVASGGRWHAASRIDPRHLRQLRSRAELALGRQIADLSSYLLLTLPAGTNSESIIDELNGLPEVELAAPVPLPTLAPSVPDFESSQGYLSPSPGGLDANFAWTIPGGNGDRVTICDIESGWNLDHEDLPPATILIPAGESVSFIPKDDHGTEVLGTMVSLRNGWGTTGASYGARCFVAPIHLDSGYGLFQQILWATSQLEAGDVLLLEAQTIGPYFRGDGSPYGYVPVEWEPAIYNAILTAVGNGIHVVEPVGNGSQNLDDPIYVAGNFGHAPFLRENDSGAIMVGAGIPPTAPELGPDRSRSSFSNFGSRLDVQAWGHRVATTGIGDLYSEEGPNRSFTRFFGGTSSAGPLVASAVASLAGIVEHGTGVETLPAIMRALITETGTPQQDGARPASLEPIGPRPDLRAAIQRMSIPVVAAPQLVRAFEGDPLRFDVYAADLEGEPLDAITAGPQPYGSSFSPSVDNDVGEFVWNTAVGQAGTYDIVFTASNTESASDTTRVVVLPAERGPVITGPGSAVGIEGGPPVTVTMQVTDPNGDPIISLAPSPLPQGASFVVDSTNTIGVLTWRPNYDQAGQYPISFTAISVSGVNGQHESGQGLLVVTIQNNDQDPVILAPSLVHVSEGEMISFRATAEDPDGDSITNIWVEGLPSGATFAVDPDRRSGTLTWNPGFDQAGSYFLNLFAESFTIGLAVTMLLVDDVDRAPLIDAPSAVHGVEGNEVTFDASTADPDGDPVVSFVGVNLPTGAIVTGTSPIHFAWTPASGTAGVHIVTLIAASRHPFGALQSESTSVVVSIESGQFAARAYLSPSTSPIRLTTGSSSVCMQFEPVGEGFDLANVDSSMVKLVWAMGTPVDRIAATEVLREIYHDLDHNGVAELRACFSRDNLRLLFGTLEEGRRTVSAALIGGLSGGGRFEALLEIDVDPQHGIKQTAITPNPVRTGSVLSFYTSAPGPAQLHIFDVRGRLVTTPLDAHTLPSGFHDITLQLKHLSAGVYYYRLESSAGTRGGQFVVLK